VTVLCSCGTLAAVQESAPAPAPITARTLQPGLVLGRYVVVDRLAAGGMAEVYLARVHGPPRFSKAIALKLLHPFLAADPTFVKMFEKEARIAATLDHPNIVQVLDVHSAGNERFLALEYVHGRDLGRVLAAGGRLPLGAALRVIIDVARALHYAHTRSDADGKPLGLVHRDVSPANVLVSFHGGVKLADFGIAKATDQTAHTATGTFKGKFGYMAPEVYLQEALDARSDVFALGVVLYEATTGKRAFAGESVAVINKVLSGKYPPPRQHVEDYPDELAAIIARAMALDADGRYASAAELADALDALAAARGLDTRPDSLAAQMRARFGEVGPPALDVPVLGAGTAMTVPVGDDAAALGRGRGTTRMIAAALALVLVSFVVGSVVGSGGLPGVTPAIPEGAAAPGETVSPAVTTAAAGEPGPTTSIPSAVAAVPSASALLPPAPAATVAPVAIPPRRPATKATAAAAAKAAACKPPYVLNPDGTKRFKPECF
jgi:serine/threonine-protein kinase